MVTIVIPYFIVDSSQHLIPGSLFIKLIGSVIGLAGITLLIYTISLFGRFGNGTLAPWQPTQKLVVIGPYRHVRNPMISGVFFILIGESLVLHSTSMLEWAGLFFLINTTYFILMEEPSLEERFGEDYRQYKKHVGRWIPRLRAYSL
jgi:protein-S-isoprenylcysteine O-methyltransferase Ste14